MDEAIRKAAAAFYQARLHESAAVPLSEKNSEQKTEPEDTSSFINYGQLAESAVSASDVLSVSPELKTMIESEKVVLKDKYYQANSALFIILEKLLAERGVKVKNLTAKTGFLNNAVFKFDAPPVEAEAREVKLPSNSSKVDEAAVEEAKVEEAKVEEAEVEEAEVEKSDDAKLAPKPVAATRVGTATPLTGGGRTRSLLQRIRSLTKKNIRRMI